MLHSDRPLIRSARTAATVISPNHPTFLQLALALTAIVGPLLLLAAWPNWSAYDAPTLLGWLSAPLFIAICIVPIVVIWKAKMVAQSILLTVLLIFYLTAFGVRALYFLISPDVKLYPNFDIPDDLINLHYGLLWASGGLLSMLLAYGMYQYATKLRPIQLRPVLRDSFTTCSAPKGIAILYVLGWLGRANAIRTGSFFYLFNSPAFDQIAVRNSSPLNGPLSILAEFCPIAFGSLLAYYLRSRKQASRPLGLLLMVVMTSLLEALYYTSGMYKYGLLGLLLVFWIAFTLTTATWPKWMWVLPAIFMFVVVPFINSSRQVGVDLYRSYLTGSSSYYQLIAESVRADNATNYQSSPLSYADTLFVRLNGAEALAVAQEQLPSYGIEYGGTYLNLATLLTPKILRFWADQPLYIDWAVRYVGLPPSDPTVIPTPTIVEAYLSWGLAGVIAVMFLLGLLYAFLDRLGYSVAMYNVGIGLFAYVVWRLSNIEHYLFIYLPATLKTVVVFVIVCVALNQLFGRRIRNV